MSFARVCPTVRRVLRAAAVTLVVTTVPVAAQEVTPELIRARSEREWATKAEKMRRHLLPVMREHGVDLWVILSRENTTDPLLELFGGYGVTGWYGHRNAYLFHDAGVGLEATAIGTHLSGHLNRFYDTATSYGEEGLRPHLREYLAARDPQRIAINQSRTISMADGLTAELKDYLLDALGDRLADRLVSSERLVVDYASRHTSAEDAIQREASEATYDILRRALSSEVITPGRTSLMDVQYWITAEWKRQGFEFNFPAALDLQRIGSLALDDADDPVIEPGDLLHVDFGVRTSGIVADQQKMAYVLRGGETAPPEGLVRAFESSRRAAAIILDEMQVGRNGADIKRRAETRAVSDAIELLVYSHVQGYWVHDAGMWAIHDWPERYGEHPRISLKDGDWVSLEFSVSVPVAEWEGQLVTIMREEDILIRAGRAPEFLSGPQTELWIVR